MTVTDSKKRTVNVGRLTLDLKSGDTRMDGELIRMPQMEYKLLRFLVEHPDRVYTKRELIREIWGYEALGQSATLTVHINRLRKKLDDGAYGSVIETVWGVGYRFRGNEIKYL